MMCSVMMIVSGEACRFPLSINDQQTVKKPRNSSCHANNDLNLNSGATPSALSNTIYAAIGYDGCVCDSPALIGLGGSYEWGRDCDALDNWAVWVKLAMAF